MIKRIAVKIVPESNGSPREFTKNTSKYPKSANVEGKRSLKMKSKIATDKTFAKRKFLKFGLGCFLKKYIMPIAGITSNPIKCTPNESPTINDIKTSHLFPLSLSISSSHLNPSQNNRAIMHVAIA